MQIRCEPAIVVALCLAGCSNPWKDNLSLQAAPRSASTGVSLVFMQPAELAVAPAPPGLVRIATADFVSGSDPSPKQLEQAAQQIGATLVQWSREFVQVTSSIDYRPEYRPGATRTTVIKKSDGTTKTITSTDSGYTEYYPTSRNDAWYRYVAFFYAPQ